MRRLAAIAAIGAMGAGAFALSANTSGQDGGDSSGSGRDLGQEVIRLSGSEVAIYNVAGSVEIVPGSGSDVMVEVVTGGDDAGQLTFETGRVRGREALRIVYPGDEVIYPAEGRGRYRTTMRVRDDGTFGDSGRRMSVRSSGSGLEAHADLRIRVPEGRRLILNHGVGVVHARGLEADLTVDVATASISVEDVVGNVEVDNGSGSITVVGVDGSVELDTGSGSVAVESVRGSSLLVDTGAGSVQAVGIDAESVSVDTGSGSVSLSDVAAEEVSVDTGSGRVEVHLAAVAEFIEVDTGSGSVELILPSGMNAELEIDTGSGSIDVDVPVEVETRRRGYFSGILGTGAGRITVDTGSGSIRVRSN